MGDTNHNSTDDDSNLLILNISRIIIHPDYDGVTSYYDVAVLETLPVIFSRGINSVCLPRCPVDKFAYLFCFGPHQIKFIQHFVYKKSSQDKINYMYKDYCNKLAYFKIKIY